MTQVWLGTRELLFRSRLRGVVERQGGAVTRDAAAAELGVVEIGGDGWEEMIGAFVARGVPVVAFGAHVRADLLRRARELGAEAVPNSQVEERVAARLAATA